MHRTNVNLFNQQYSSSLSQKKKITDERLNYSLLCEIINSRDAFFLHLTFPF